MRKLFYLSLILGLFVIFGVSSASALSTEDIAKASTLEEILKRGELRVGLEAGYQPFEM